MEGLKRGVNWGAKTYLLFSMFLINFYIMLIYECKKKMYYRWM